MTGAALNIPVRGNVATGTDRILSLPSCRVTQSTPQTFTTGVIAAITFDATQSSVAWDNAAYYIPTVSTSRLYPRTTGYYSATAAIVYTASAAGVSRSAWIQKNGVTTVRYGFASYTAVAAIAATTYVNVATTIQVNAGDYLELMGFQDSGGSLNTTTNGATAPSAELALCLISLP